MAEESDKPFSVDRAKLGRAACKKCKEKCMKGELRLAKLTPSPYGDGKMKNWHHLECLFEQFLKQKPTTRRLESSNDLDGWETLNKEDQDSIAKKFEEYEKLIAEKHNKTYEFKEFSTTSTTSTTDNNKSPATSSKNNNQPDGQNRDSLFREYRRLIANITNISSYTEKTALVTKLFTKGCDGDGFKGDMILWCRLLLPGVVKRIYNLQSKQLVKLFSRIFVTDQSEMLEHLEQGDIGETIQQFHEQSRKCVPAKKSLLTLQEVDDFLEALSKLTKEDDQIDHLTSFLPKCTSNDLKILIRLIKHDLRMNAGAKHILEGVHPDAYETYQSSRDLSMVISRFSGGDSTVKGITVLTPVLPMLAEPCKSIEQAMKKCPNGIYSEIKYDGERVQVHKKGTEFKYFSRSLKPVMAHKIAHFKDYIAQAFPHGKDLILDSEILMMDTSTGKPLPFGTLGKHKKNGLQDATVCLFVFDCIYYNGENLAGKPLKERKRVLYENMTEIPNHIVFSELKEIEDPKDLASMITKVLKLGLEGLVLKDVCSIYEPGKRHWLKVKKDYLFDGAMADSADLIVLGAWYGTGKKGGIMSVFLMGVHDPIKDNFRTVTKVHTGHDDKTLERLQGELDMIKISGDTNKVPSWLKCTKTMIPDFVASDPRKQPIWEVTGAEFTQIHDVHTANGISIRFPRVTKIRDDKNWKTSTNLQELDVLFKNSKDNFDGSLFNKELENLGSTKTKIKSPIKKYLDTSPSSSASPKKVKRKINSSPTTSYKVRKVEIKNPLPDYFENIQLSLALKYESKHKELLRHFVAYSGTVLNEDEWHLSTHMLHDSSSVREQVAGCPKSAKHVTVDWIQDSILKQSLLNIQPYMVEYLPSG